MSKSYSSVKTPIYNKHPLMVVVRRPFCWMDNKGKHEIEDLIWLGSTFMAEHGVGWKAYFAGQGTPYEAKERTAGLKTYGELIDSYYGYIWNASSEPPFPSSDPASHFSSPISFSELEENTAQIQSGPSFTEYERALEANREEWGLVAYKTTASDFSQKVSWLISSYSGGSSDFSDGIARSSASYIYAVASSAKGTAFFGFYHKGTSDAAIAESDIEGGIEITSSSTLENKGYEVTATRGLLDTKADVTDAVAVFGLKFTMEFRANGGAGEMDNATRVMGASPYKTAADGEDFQSIPACAFTNGDKVCAGWSTTPDGEPVIADGAAVDENFYAALKDYVTVGNGTSYTFYAQWRDKNIIVTKKNNDGSDKDVAGVGTLQLFSDVDGYVAPVAQGGVNGRLLFDGASGRKYRLSCAMDASNFFWKALGVSSPTGYVAEYDIDFSTATEAVAIEYCFEINAIYTVEVQSEHGAVTVSPGPDKAGKYVRGRELVLSVVPDAGWRAVQATFVNKDTGDVETAQVVDNAVRLDGITFNVKVVIDYALVDYSLAAEVHEASAGAITEVAVADADGSPAATAHYGETATFTATVADGYQFAGWYDADGALVSADASYAATVAGDLALTAKAKVKCSLAIQYKGTDGTIQYTGTDEAETCSLTVDGAAYEPGTMFDVVLGGSFSYELALGEYEDGKSWLFDSWRSPSNGESIYNAQSLPYDSSGTIAPTAGLSMVAVVAKSVTRTLKVYCVRVVDGQGTIVGSVQSPARPFTCSALAETVAEGSASGSGSGGAGMAAVGPDPFAAFSFERTQRVRLTAASAATFAEGEDAQAFRFFATTGFAPSGTSISLPEESAVLSWETYADILLASDEQFVFAYYGTPTRVKVSLGYASLSDSTMGELAVDSSTDSGATVAADGLSAEVMQSESLSVRATPANGYRFVGWFRNAAAVGDPLSTEAEFTYLVTAQTTICAKFAKDASTICEWEGSSENKALVWRSKTYESSKPFNPSACRVDALGYAGDARGSLLELTVDMFSAPDAAATASVTLVNIASQDARRLPVRRMERYMQVAVKADAEVDALLVGTSMGGLT